MPKRGKRIKPSKLKQYGKLSSPELPDPPLTINFSFKYLDFSNPKFDISGSDSRFFRILFDRLKSISQMKIAEFFNDRTPALRCHEINWGKTSEPGGFRCLNKFLREKVAFQFQITKRKGRVHGLIFNSTFCVVWLDPKHKLYPLQ